MRRCFFPILIFNLSFVCFVKAGPVTRDGNETEFAQVLNGVIPCKFLHEDDHCVAFFEKYPLLPIHFIVIPRKPIPSLDEAKEEDEELLGHLLLVANKVAQEVGLTRGYRIIINTGPAVSPQYIKHLHLHVFGGRQLLWPPG